MKHDSDNRQVITDYLLGSLAREELERFEERYLEDGTLFEELQEIEDELIDDYVSGALSAEQRKQFEEYFLRSPQRREKVEFARGITEHALEWKKEGESGAPESSTPALGSSSESDETISRPGKVLLFKRWSQPVPAWRQWGAIAVVVLLAVGGGTLWRRNRELRQELIAAGSNEARLRQEVEAKAANTEELQAKVTDKERDNLKLQQRLAEAIARAPHSLVEGAGKAVFTTFLRLGEMAVGGTRGGDEPKIKTLEIPTNTQSVHLEVEVDKNKYRTFQATLERRDADRPAFSRGGLRPGNKSTIALDIPASQLTPGDYILTLSGVTPQGNREAVGKHYLKVVRR
jgi:anti-sigma-K factor RskA